MARRNAPVALALALLAGMAAPATARDARPPGLGDDGAVTVDGGYLDFLLGGPRERTGAAADVVPMGEADVPTRRRVSFETAEPAGSILIDTKARRLYLVERRGSALSYLVGVGREGFGWHGTETVSAKRRWPDWRPPADMLARRPDLPRHMPGGPANPLGAGALYLGSTLYRIHGSNEPESVGEAASSGCFRMRNADLVDLYGRVAVGARVTAF